ncbi:hypothetical protein [Ruminococcus sp. JL13D9]|uniref:hypothetical protein n=1 Tax=Ruminococcus sp. JL13D9 TaxID=3233381 RepID=UPI00389AA3FF
MKFKAKKLISILLVVVIIISVAITGISSSFAADAPPNPNRLPEYTPSAGVETRNVMFAMPGFWTGSEGSADRETWEKYGSTAGLYWWGGDDNPDEAPAANGHGWPGWKMKKNPYIPNLYSTAMSKSAPNAIFSNFVDGGMDTSYPEYNASQHTKDLQIEYFGQGDSDYYPKEFWDYLYDNYYDAFLENSEYSIKDFGDYAGNFFFDEYDDAIYQYIDDMIFVVDYNQMNMQISIVSGKGGYDGAFYFYYGNGEFGIWPTKELCVKQEGLSVDESGKVITDGETVDEKTGFILREHTDAYDTTTKRDFVVFGNITGEYWNNKEINKPVSPTIPTDDSTTFEPSHITPNPNVEYTTNKVYFEAPDFWKNYKNITMYLYNHNGEEVIAWGSKKGNMTKEDGNTWSFDFNAKGITIDSGKQYGVIFTADWGVQTCDLIMDASCLGDVAFCDGKIAENSIDYSRKAYIAWWNNADPEKYGPALCITSLGNVVGYSVWADTTKYDMLVNFIKSDGMDGLNNALKYNGKTAQETLDDLAKALGLSADDIERAIAESGKFVDWQNPNGSTPQPTVPGDDEQFEQNVKDAADYLLRYSGNDKMTAPKKVKELIRALDVDFYSVEEALFYRCDGDFSKFKPAVEALHRADSLYMDVVKGDTNGDGVVDIIDATLIQMLAADKITSFD